MGGGASRLDERTGDNPDERDERGIRGDVRLPFAEATARAREALGKEGFGVLTEIDVQATMKAKLGVEVPPYVILGACHPPSAHQSLTAAPEVGVLLPCNVTVSVEGGRTVVRAMNPGA